MNFHLRQNPREMEDFCIKVSKITHHEDENWFYNSDIMSESGEIVYQIKKLNIR